VRFTAKSISAKITWMNMLVSGLALLLAVSAFFAYDQLTFRQELVHALSAQAQIISSNSVSALVFNDPQAANNTLSALRSSPNIESAGIFRPNRAPFAEYLRAGGTAAVNIPALPNTQEETYQFRSTHLILVEPINFQGQMIGFVYVRSDLREIDRRLKRYGAIAAVVLILCLLAASFASYVFRESVVTPIVALSQVARAVSQGKNYSVRAPPSKEQDEVALLVNAFNDMLIQIQARDGELRKAHDELERRVEDRTRELVVANRELEAFSYSVSHDLRGPVDAVNGFSYVLAREYSGKLDEKGRELVDRIRNSGRRMMQLIDDLLNLSRVTSGAMQYESVNLTEIVQNISNELVGSAPDRKVDFAIAEVGTARGDPRLLRVLLENLLRNAWKYTSQHPTARIEFGVQNDDGKPVYFVRDDGVGFDPRSADRLFQPFQRLHSFEEFPGNGVGLATVQRIVRRHGGEVWAQSEVEKGATFYFYLGKTNNSRPELRAQ
jgi:signal transduction histidine kinase